MARRQEGREPVYWMTTAIDVAAIARDLLEVGVE
jgi:hypothetical protein